MKVNGVMIRLMDEVSSSIQQVLGTKESGWTTCSMGRGRRLGTMEVRATKDSSTSGKRMVEAGSTGRTAASMKDSSLTDSSTDTAPTTLLTFKRLTRVNSG